MSEPRVFDLTTTLDLRALGTNTRPKNLGSYRAARPN